MRNKEMDHNRGQLLLLDSICMILSFFLATWIRYGINPGGWFKDVYGMAFVVVLLSYICIFFLTDTGYGIFKRGFLDEFGRVFQNNILLAFFITAILFLYQRGLVYSRTFFVCFFFCNVCIDYLVRQYYKILLLAYFKKSGLSTKVMIITTLEQANGIVEQIKRDSLWNCQITGIVILDEELVGRSIGSVKVVAGKRDLYDVVVKEVVDEIFISLPYDHNETGIDEMILAFENMGIIVNLSIAAFQLDIKEKTVKDFGGYHVLTFATKVFDKGSMAFKRAVDIAGAMVGLTFTLLFSVILTPVVLIESPGPLIFSQIRIGKNGRRFKIYKFRSMYQDAEKHKKDLMNQNEMGGLMFKITDDPRITKVGRFLRKTSLDEFPQFFNVLKGDMSLVGTRPPTEDEFLQYEGRHKRRLALKPGITGLWQVNGRGETKDFEDVVKMDLDYIDHWSIGLDFKILVKTIFVVIFGVGAK